jgi:hypothetical protein
MELRPQARASDLTEGLGCRLLGETSTDTLAGATNKHHEGQGTPATTERMDCMEPGAFRPPSWCASSRPVAPATAARATGPQISTKRYRQSLCPSGSCRHLLRQVKMTCRIPCRGDWLAADYPHGRRTERRLRGAASGTFQAKPATKTSEKYNCGSGSPSTEHVGRPASRMRCENTRAQACVTMRHLVPSPLDISRSYDHDL